MKKNKLYTVNKWNKAAFMPEGNLFGGGGNSRADYTNEVMFGSSPQSSSNTVTSSSTPRMPYINWRDSMQSKIATSISKGMIDTFTLGNNNVAGNFGSGLTGSALAGLLKSNQLTSLLNAYNLGKNKALNTKGSSFNKGAAMLAIGSAALNVASAIDTGDRNGLFDTLDPVYHLAGGRESKVGNALSDIGVALTKSGNPWMMLAGAGLKIVGGLTNAAFGIKTNQAGLNAANQSISTNNNFVSNALSYDDIKGPASMTNTKIHEGGWFSGGKADDMNNALANQMGLAYSWAERSILNNANNIGANMISNQLRYKSALGGPLHVFDMGGDTDGEAPIDYRAFENEYAKRLAEWQNNRGTAAFKALNSISDDYGIDRKEALAYGDIHKMKNRSFPNGMIIGRVPVKDIDALMEAGKYSDAMGIIRNGYNVDALKDLTTWPEGSNVDTGITSWYPQLIKSAAKSARAFNNYFGMAPDGDDYIISVDKDNFQNTLGDNTDYFARDVKALKQATENANTQAYGGPMHIFDFGGYVNPSTAIGYSLYTDKYAKDKEKDNSHMTNMFAGTSIFDFGGGIHTKGTDFDNGISYINVGGSHEENPNEGVLMGVDNKGVPNLVEEGEVRWNDYIFSDRLTVPNYKKEYKKKSKDIPYEAQVLWDNNTKTFADAAKRIIKKNGEGNDPITMRGNEAQLAVLALVLEKEREKEKLREMQEAIDNMSPEEFAMLQLQMLAQQNAQLQQQAAMQLQQMIPLGMELMLPVELMQPIAALGGLLDNYGRQFEYGGDLKAFTEDLLKYGLTINDYLKYLVDSNKIKGDYDIYAEMGLTDDEFDKDLAEDYIKHIKTSTKKVERLYKTQGKNPKQLEGSALLKYNEDIQKAIKNPALLLNDENKELFVNQVGKGDIKTFSAAADNAVVKENKLKTFGNPMTAKDGKFAVEYNKPEDAAEDWKPEPAHVIDNPVFILDGKFVDKEGNVVDNPYEGHGLTSPTRDWSKFGYVNPKDQSWTDVDYSTAPKDASGNELYKYQAWDKWFKDSKMDADEYEGLDAYINNYLDFLDDIYTEGSNAEDATAEEKALYLRHKQAMLRLYAMGESTKSKNPKELEGKNRYFDTEREGFDADNLTLDDIRVINGYNVLNPNNLEGLAPNKLDGYKDKLYYVTKDGYLIPEEDYNRLEGTDKDKYTPLKDAAGEARKGLTRNDLFNHVKSLRNDTGLTLTLLWNSMFDNVPAQSYLMAPRASNRYALVDKNGLLISKDGKPLYIDPDVVNNGLYSIYNNGNPIVLDTVGDATIRTIGVLGGEYNPHVAVVDGEYYNLTPEQAQLYAKYKVTDPKKISSYTGFEDAIPGYTVSPTYYELPDELLEEAGLKVRDDGTGVYKPNGVPKPTLWPLFAAMGLLGLGLLHNIASPIDYSNADALLTASRDAGNYFPIEYRPMGNFVPYRPEDPWFTTYPIILQYNTTAKSILNSGVNQGSKNAAMVANAYNSNEAQGKATQQRLVNNTDALSKSIIANNDLYKTWSEGFLKADMANLDAATRAAGFKLEGMKHALAMKQGLLDAKANAINAGLSGLAELAYNYGNNKTLTDLLRWGMQNEIWGPRATYFKGEKSSRAKGGKVRRKRGLGF